MPQGRSSSPGVECRTPKGYSRRGHPVKFCGRCDQPIRGKQAYTEHMVDSPSVGGDVVYLHVGGCRPVPIQRTQEYVGR